MDKWGNICISFFYKKNLIEKNLYLLKKWTKKILVWSWVCCLVCFTAYQSFSDQNLLKAPRINPFQIKTYWTHLVSTLFRSKPIECTSYQPFSDQNPLKAPCINPFQIKTYWTQLVSTLFRSKPIECTSYQPFSDQNLLKAPRINPFQIKTYWRQLISTLFRSFNAEINFKQFSLEKICSLNVKTVLF